MEGIRSFFVAAAAGMASVLLALAMAHWALRVVLAPVEGLRAARRGGPGEDAGLNPSQRGK
jgi:hypothetical protein